MPTCQEPGPDAGNPSRPARSRAARDQSPQRMKSINRFSADHDWSRWFSYRLIREGHLRTVQVLGRKRITAQAEAAFDEAVANGLLTVPSK